jgi:N-acetylglucosamine-6-phosphate deacetylase
MTGTAFSSTGGAVVIARALTLETFPCPAAAVFRDGRIASLEPQEGRGLPPAAASARLAGAIEVDGTGSWLLPAWIDLQVNDLDWLAGGLRTPVEHAARIREVLARQAGQGVTGLLLATMAAPVEEVLAYLEGIAIVRRGRERAPDPGPPARDPGPPARGKPRCRRYPCASTATGGTRARDGERAGSDGVLLGGLVEGTFMNPACHGAHNPDHILPFDLGLAERFLATGGLRAINIAPETSAGAIDGIRSLAGRGVLVGCGHARPSGLLAREAVKAGLAYVIHLGNGPTGSSLKGFSEGGLLEEALRDDSLSVTLILDGLHLDPRIVRDIIERKGIGGVAAITDVAFAAGPPPGEFEVLGVRGRLARDGRWLEVAVPPPVTAPGRPGASDHPPVLFGSTIGMRDAFENALNWLTVGMDGVWTRRHPALVFSKALRAAVAMTSTNPARLLGETDRGRLEPGARADAVLAAVEGEPGRYRVEVDAVFL